MKLQTAIASALLLCCNAGCLSVCNNAYRTLVKEPKQFSWRRDRCESRTLYASWAADAWSEQRSSGVECRSADFVLGFQEGFVEYCYAGGTGEPPPVPPRPYWNSLNRVAPLRTGAYEWFDGYRLGARIAREGGYRDQAVVPASASLCSKGGVAGGDAGCPCKTSPITTSAADAETVAPPVPHPVDYEPIPATSIETNQMPDELSLPALDSSTPLALPQAVAPAGYDTPPAPTSQPAPQPLTPGPASTAPSNRSLRREIVPQSASRRFGNDFLR